VSDNHSSPASILSEKDYR